MKKVLIVISILLLFAMPSLSQTISPSPFGQPQGSNGGIRWTKQINLGSGGNPCDIHNDAIAEFMDGTVTDGSIRFHHDGKSSISIVAQTGFVDHGPYKSCFVVHPSTDGTTYPDPFAATALSNIAAGSHIRIQYDDVRTIIDQSSLSENAKLYDIGNSWGAGDAFGNFNSGLTVAGSIDVTIGAGQQAAVGADDRVIPSPGTSDPLNSAYVDAFAALSINGEGIDAGGLKVRWSNLDDTDIGCQFVDTNRSLLPSCSTIGDETANNDGVGIQFINSINAEIAPHTINGMDYGIILGSPLNRGEAVHYSSCADSGGGGCANKTGGVRGIASHGSYVSNSKYANLVDLGGDEANAFHDPRWLSDAGSDIASVLLRPYICDGSTGSDPAPFGVPVQADESTDCLDMQLIVTAYTSLGGGQSDIDVVAHGLSVGDDVYIEGTGNVLLDHLTHNVDVVVSVDEITVDVDTVTSDTSLDGRLSENTVAPVAAIIANGPSGRGELRIDGGSAGGGSTDTRWPLAPAIMLGEDFVNTNYLYLTGGLQLCNSQDGSNDMFTFHTTLVRADQADTRISLDGLVGVIDTSGARPCTADPSFPVAYDGWNDTREVEIIWFNIFDPVSAGTHWNQPLVLNNTSLQCIGTGISTSIAAEVGVSCNSVFAARLLVGTDNIYFTRLQIGVTKRMNGEESCSYRLSVDRQITEELQIHIPHVDGIDYNDQPGGYGSYIYALEFLKEADQDLTIQVGDGLFSELGVAPECIGAFGITTRIRGFKFDPYEL